jgi:primosomal protein N' (replication factor Y)
MAARPVDVEPAVGPEAVLRGGHLVVGTAAAVKDAGPQDVEVVAILDPDRGLRRPGIHAGEQAVATWMEAAAWAAPAREEASGGATSGRHPRSAARRVLTQTRHAGHPALQALIRWEPMPFLLSEARARTESGFPPNHPVFRIEGGPQLSDALRQRDGAPEAILETTAADRTVCLVAIPPARLAFFRREAMRLAAEGVVIRVEAEPQL